MKCAWKELMTMVPPKYREFVDRHRTDVQEIRLRIGQSPQLIGCNHSGSKQVPATQEDLNWCVNAASRYSPWTASGAAEGYVTGPGGHRIGLCGDSVIRDGNITGIHRFTSLCIRVARDFPGIATGLEKLDGSVLILGRPGGGKTTLLRDLIRNRGQKECICVVDERRELFPDSGCFEKETGVDVLSGCPKKEGIEILLRTMGPDCIAVDEITSEADTQALCAAAWCGVRLLATAHASSVEDLLRRKVYRPLWESGLFEHAVILLPDKSWITERLDQRCSSGSVRY